jgi:phage/plasmid primase-like uncharacterized protein
MSVFEDDQRRQWWRECIERARGADILLTAQKLGARLKRIVANEYAGPCPRCGGTDRFSVNTRKRVFNCRRSDESGGDVIDMVRYVTGCSFIEACEFITDEPRPDRSRDVRPTQRVAKQATAPAAPPRADRRGLALWRKAARIDRTPADLYLGARGFVPPYPATLGYLPGLGDHPHALIAALGLPNEPEPGLLRIPDAAVRAVHLTRLDPTGTKRLKTDDAKIIVGQGGLGFPVAVTPISDGLGLLIAEGIENALSLGLSLGLGAWASCGHTRMPALASAVPSHIVAVTIVADPEPEARASACALAERLERRGFNVIVKPMGEAV